MVEQLGYGELMSAVESHAGNYELPDSACQIPPRSRLYNLEPVGVGSALVESISSYIYRLAQAHHVRPAVLLKKIIMPAIDNKWKSKGVRGPLRAESSFVTAVMGIGKTAYTMVTALECLTTSEKLRFLTMLPWRKIFAYQSLIKPVRAWCPDCLEVWQSNRTTVYEPLLWAVDVVKVCTIHLCRLESQCNSCNCHVPHLVYAPRVGRCSKCGYWLGYSKRKRISSEEIADELWIAKEVGVLLSAAYDFGESLDDNVVVNLLLGRVGGAERGVIGLSAQVGFQPRQLIKWKSKDRRPQLLHFLQLVKRLDLSVYDALSGNHAGIKPQAEGRIKQPQSKSRKRAERRSDWSNDAEVLSKALAEQPPPSLFEVAKRLQLDTDIEHYIRRLYFHLPELCRAISSRYEEYKKYSMLTYLNTFLESNKCPPLSMRQVAKRISKKEGRNVTSYLYIHFTEHHKIISARYRAYKVQQIVERGDLMRERLRQAVSALKSQGTYPSYERVAVFLNLKTLGKRYKTAVIEIRKEFNIETQARVGERSKD